MKILFIGGTGTISSAINRRLLRNKGRLLRHNRRLLRHKGRLLRNKRRLLRHKGRFRVAGEAV